jgi:SAM-dependent methyltransferase
MLACMRRVAAAADRNKVFIAEVLERVLPPSGLVLEVASGTGQHAVFLAERFPHLSWQPTDLDAEALASIAAWREEAALSNLRPPLPLDASAPASWPLDAADAVVCTNMIHIAPWSCCLGLLEGAARILPPGAPLVIYGPFHVDHRPTTPSNAAFDADLRARDPAWGVRDLGDVTDAARERGLERAEVVEMPANNKTLVFRRSRRAP